MVYIPVPDAVHVQLLMDDAGEPIMNDLYFNAGGTPTTGDMTTLGTALINWWGNDLAPLICDQVGLRQVRLTDLGSPIGAQVTLADGSIGGVTTEQAPNNVAPCISFRTPFRGRSFRGRNYVPGVPNTMVNINTLDGSWTAAIKAVYEELLPGGGVALPGLYEWVVVSRYTGGGPRVTGIFTNVISCGFTDLIVDSQRRRLPRH